MVNNIKSVHANLGMGKVHGDTISVDLKAGNSLEILFLPNTIKVFLSTDRTDILSTFNNGSMSDEKLARSIEGIVYKITGGTI